MYIYVRPKLAAAAGSERGKILEREKNIFLLFFSLYLPIYPSLTQNPSYTPWNVGGRSEPAAAGGERGEGAGAGGATPATDQGAHDEAEDR